MLQVVFSFFFFFLSALSFGLQYLDLGSNYASLSQTTRMKDLPKMLKLIQSRFMFSNTVNWCVSKIFFFFFFLLCKVTESEDRDPRDCF